jgi:hypothetical protein
MTVHHLIRWIREPTDATIIRCIFLELNQINLNMFRASLCPSSGKQERDWIKRHVKMPGCAGCDCVEPLWGQCALFESCCCKSAHCLHHGSTQSQPAQPGIFIWSFNQSHSCSTYDGHNDARNILRLIWFNSRIIHLIIVASVGSIIHMPSLLLVYWYTGYTVYVPRQQPSKWLEKCKNEYQIS